MKNLPKSFKPENHRSTVALTRSSLFNFVALLIGIFLLASCMLLFLARDLDKTEEEESAFYTAKAVHASERGVASTLKDYAFWGDAYKHLHLQVDPEWAYVRQNIGTTLYADFGFQGLFVIDESGRTVYAVVDGDLKNISIEDWLGQPTGALVAQARKVASEETPVTSFMNVKGVPAIVAAAAITPGTDPTVEPDGRAASVLIFVDLLTDDKLAKLGRDYGVQDLRVAAPTERHQASYFALGDNGEGGALRWTPPTPGHRLLALGLPLTGFAALLVCLMAWVILRRTTAAASALDESYLSLRRSQAALATSEARFRDVVEASSDWVWEIDQDWCFTYLSERFEAVTAFSRQDWIGVSIDTLLNSQMGTVSQWLSIPNRKPDITISCRYIDTQGEERVTRLSARQLPEGGFRGTATDITEEVEARRRIEFLSQHDALTGLPNRVRLQEFLDGKFKALPTKEQPLVMLSLDLDRFKPVNDLLGHAAGDRVLNDISARLSECVRHGDLVARVGGDEFVLILTDAKDPEEVESLCRRLIESIEMPVVVDEQEVFVSASIGIAMAPTDAREAAEFRGTFNTLRYRSALLRLGNDGCSVWPVRPDMYGLVAG